MYKCAGNCNTTNSMLNKEGNEGELHKTHIERCKIRNLEKLDYKPLSREKCNLKAYIL
jgi:hypothetical protein